MKCKKKNIAIVLISIGAIIISALILFALEDQSILTSKEVVAEKVLIPGGQSIGIKMNVKGVLVVGLEEIETKDSISNPAFDAGLQVGDKILKVNNKAVDCPRDLQKALQNLGSRHVEISYERHGKEYSCVANLAKSIDDNQYKLGLWVKDKIAGIGTLTYYDPVQNTFGCLGHGILESQTSQLLEVGRGQLLETKIKSIDAGKVGEPGQIQGVFINETMPLGNIKANTNFGVFGDSNENLCNILEKKPMAICSAENIKRGKAYILTTINEEGVKPYEIEITNVNVKEKNDNKGIQYDVVDESLKKECGGIIQGMSGSPIIQNGRIVGAVTHVLVDNPQKGYGIFIENMINTNKNI